MLTNQQREQLNVVLVSPRNPLNIGAVARAMANFGFSHLSVATEYLANWREAKSAVGAPHLLESAQQFNTLAEAIAECSFAAGTGSLTYRKPEQPVVSLPELAPMMQRAMESGGRAALVFGPEKHGLTREDLAFCHVLVEIPTDDRQPSMNLGQAAAVCLYELVRPQPDTEAIALALERSEPQSSGRAEAIERLGDLMEQVMLAADYSPASMRAANRHDLRVLLRRLRLTDFDVRRAMGLFRRILYKLPGDGRSR